MWRRIGLLAAGLALVTIAVWWTRSGGNRTTGSEAPPAAAATVTTDSPALASAKSRPMPDAGTTWSGRVLQDPIIIGPCPIMPVGEQDVSSQVEGVLGEIAVKLGQQVTAGQVLARLDDRLLRPQVELLQIKASSNAAQRIARGQFEESDANLAMARRLSGKAALPPLEFRTYMYQRDRHAEELRKAEEDQEIARKELAKAQRTLELYEIKSRIAGEVTRIYRRQGETIKDTEPLVCVTNFDRLRIEGLCKVQHANLFRVGMRVLVEPEVRGEQLTELSGHTAPITSLAVAADGRVLASASEDRTVLVWTWPQAARLACLRHPAEVLAVAIAAPRPGSGYEILTGAADGKVRLWSVTSGGAVSGPNVFTETHEGAIRALALTPDGTRLASGGEDRRIGIWDIASCKRLFWVQAAEGGQEDAHHGAITALHFTQDGSLVSAGRDNTLRVWKLEARGAAQIAEHLGRSGDVVAPGVSPDGRCLLFDHGEELRILDRDGGATLGSLRGQRQGRFTGFACFSPTGRTILTACNNGRLQVWTTPTTPNQKRFFREGYARGIGRDTFSSLLFVSAVLSPPGWVAPVLYAGTGARGAGPQLWPLDGYEARYFAMPMPAAVSSGVFAPDGTVLFTAGTDRVVRAWAAPFPDASVQPLEAEITYVGNQVERGTDTVRIRAEVDNPGDPARRLRPGTYANLRLYPEISAGR